MGPFLAVVVFAIVDVVVLYSVATAFANWGPRSSGYIHPDAIILGSICGFVAGFAASIMCCLVF